MINMYDDRELVGKILNGNKSIFSMLVKKYEKMVWFMVSKIKFKISKTKIEQAGLKVSSSLISVGIPI